MDVAGDEDDALYFVFHDEIEEAFFCEVVDSPAV